MDRISFWNSHYVVFLVYVFFLLSYEVNLSCPEWKMHRKKRPCPLRILWSDFYCLHNSQQPGSVLRLYRPSRIARLRAQSWRWNVPHLALFWVTALWMLPKRTALGLAWLFLSRKALNRSVLWRGRRKSVFSVSTSGKCNTYSVNIFFLLLSL